MMVFDDLCDDLRNVMTFSDFRDDFERNGLDISDYGYDNHYCNMEERFEEWRENIAKEAAKDALKSAGVDENANDIDGSTYEEIYEEAERYIYDSYHGFIQDCIDEAYNFNDSDIMSNDDEDSDYDDE